jgi:colanic acid/amylovoran biosynthesis glycosyltransferase
MELLFVTGRFPQRSETFIYRKAVGLAKRGHHVTVATRRIGDWSLYPDPLPATMTVEELPPDDSLRHPGRAIAAAAGALRFAAKSPAAARRLYDLCQRDRHTFLRHLPLVGRRPDLVHFEFLGLGPMYAHAREVLNVPVILSCRGQDVHMLEMRAPPERDALLDCLRRADALHCVSDEMARTVARLTGRRDRVWVNRPAVDTERITPRPSASSAGPLRLLVSGRLVWVKGLDYLLAALARLVRRGVRFHADILGDGELKNFVRDRKSVV